MNARFSSTRAGLRAAVGALAAELGHDVQTPEFVSPRHRKMLERMVKADGAGNGAVSDEE